MQKKAGILFSYIAFWLFLLFFKFGAGLHYALISPLGARLMPLWIVGMIMSIGSIIQLVLDIPAGKILDRFGYRRVLIISTIFAVVGGILLFSAHLTILAFILSSLFMTVGWLFFGPGRNAYSLTHATKKNAERFMSYRDMFGSIGIVLSCVALPFIVNESFRTISIIISGLLLVSLIAIFLSRNETKKLTVKAHPHERTHLQRSLALRNIWKVLKNLNPASTLLILLGFTGSVFYGIVWFVVPLVISNLPQNSGILGIGLAMFDFSIVVVGSLLYTIVEKAEKKSIIFFGMLLFAIAGMFVGVSFGLLFLLFAFLTTTGDEVASLPLWAWLHRLDKNHNKDGLISGVINVFEDLGWAIGPLVAGIIYEIIGATWSIAIGAIPIFIVLIVYQLAVRKHVIKVSLLEAPRRPHKQRHKQ